VILSVAEAKRKRRKRDKVEIIAGVLEVCWRTPLPITWICSRAALNSTSAHQLINILLNAGLIKERYSGYRKLKVQYQTTELGQEFLRKYRELKSMVEG